MYNEKKKDHSGRIYYSFTYVNEEGRRVRLKKADTPFIGNEAKAKEWANSQEAYRESKRAFIAKKLEWKTKFYQYDELLNKYTIYHARSHEN